MEKKEEDLKRPNPPPTNPPDTKRNAILIETL